MLLGTAVITSTSRKCSICPWSVPFVIPVAAAAGTSYIHAENARNIQNWTLAEQILTVFLNSPGSQKYSKKNIGAGVQIFTTSPGVRGLMEIIIVLALDVVRSQLRSGV